MQKESYLSYFLLELRIGFNRQTLQSIKQTAEINRSLFLNDADIIFKEDPFFGIKIQQTALRIILKESSSADLDLKNLLALCANVVILIELAESQGATEDQIIKALKNNS